MTGYTGQDNVVKAMLGCVIMEPEKFIDRAIASGITSQDIRRVDPHGVKFWEAILKLHAANLHIDEVSVGKETGDYTYVESLTFALPSGHAFDTYIQIIRESAARAKIQDIPIVIQRALAETGDASEALAKIQEYIAEVDLGIHGTAGFEPATDLFMRLSEGLEDGTFDTSGTPTGIASLDRYISGLYPGRFYILAGRPGGGKTSLALGVVRHQAVNLGKKCAIISLEMSNDELGLRLLSGESGIEEERIRKRRLSSDEWGIVAAATRRLGEAEIFMDDRVSFDVSAMESRVRKMDKDIGGLDLLVVDYIQLMSARGRGSNRQEQVAAISRSLKSVAKTIQCPVLGLSQLSRLGADGRPSLEHLRESGALEQDADFVGMLYPEGARISMFVPKYRFGQPGKEIQLEWDPSTTTFK